MLSFKDFVEAEMATSEPAPQGVDPAMWANPSYQRFWKAQNQQQKVAPQAGQTNQQAKPYQQQQGYQDMNSIETGIKTYLSKMPGMPTNGTLRNLPDTALVQAISRKIKTGELPLQPSAQYAMGAGRGIHFYQDKTGNIAFFVNR